jgi:magnesium transporter
MRQLLDRLQDLEAPLLDGATDAKTYREVTRLRRELNPFERSLMHAVQFADTIAAERPRANAGLTPLAGNLADDCARLDSEFSMLRDRTSELIQTYRDNVDAQLNNTMRALTVLSAMFLPLSFITGFYGMNLPDMPTAGWRGTFPIVLTVMVAVVAGTFAYARRRKWL